MFYNLNSDNCIIAKMSMKFPGSISNNIDLQIGDYIIDNVGYKAPDKQSIINVSKKGVVTFIPDIQAIKTTKIVQCKSIASETILNKYPLHSQQNITTGALRASMVISYEMGKTIESVNAEVYSLLSKVNDVNSLISFRGKQSTIDFTSFLTVPITATEAQKKMIADDQIGLKNGYNSVLDSIVTTLLINYVRNWCKAKENLINSSTKIEQLDAIDLTDCPDIA